jgi:hypothetical protein
MKIFLVLTAGFLSGAALAQTNGVGLVIPSAGANSTVVLAIPELRTTGPSADLAKRLTGSLRGRAGEGGQTVYNRFLLDSANHVLFGYDLVIEPQPGGTYRAVFRNLSMTPAEAATIPTGRGPAQEQAGSSKDASKWVTRSLPKIPEPRAIHDGDSFSVDFFADASTGEKLTDDIRIQFRTMPAPPMRPPPPPPPPGPPPSLPKQN